jgi:proton-dependent oligopeptide transporter, POT family
MSKRSSFPRVFWVANSVEILERFAYYGIYMGFGIYMEYLGYSKAQLGIVQSIFLLFSYTIPVISGTFADRFGFKKVLIVSYLAYLPSILLLLLTKSFSGIALTMLSIGLAAGIFKPLVSGTVRVTTDSSNKTLGFGIFYQMVNIGGTFGPILAGQLRAISWNHAFIAAAIMIVIMLLVTVFFYKEPERDIQGETLGKKFKDIYIALSDGKFLLFLILIGLFFWLPFWAFFNMMAMYIDGHLDTIQLYHGIRSVLGTWVTSFLSHQGTDGQWRILGESIANTGFAIIIFQLVVSRISEKFNPMKSFMVGLFIQASAYVVIALSIHNASMFVILGVFLFAVGEMTASPRIQEYITWIAPKEKAGLYMGSNFLAVGLGGTLSGIIYTSLYGYYEKIGHVEYVWYTLSAHLIIGILLIYWFTRTLGEFKEMEK